MVQQLRESKVQPPAPDVLERQLLERMITERSLLQFAKETGVRVDDTTVERAILRIAQDNKLSPDEFRKVLEREGIPYAKYREDIRSEITDPARCASARSTARVIVTDAEVDNFLATSRRRRGGETEYLLSHILVLGAGAGVARADRAAPPARARRRCEQLRVGARLRAGRGGVLRCARRAAGRQPRLAHAGAAADGVRRRRAQA